LIAESERDQRILDPGLSQDSSPVSRLETVLPMSEPKESRLV
jgi:hypothetical protein